MKPKFRSASRFSSLSTVIFAGVLAANSLHAQNLYWDGNTTTAGAGNTTALLNRTWGTFDAWNSDSTGGAAGAFQTATANTNDLFFVAGPSATSGNVNYTVTVSGTQVARSLNFQAPATTTISGGTSITLGNGTAGVGGINVNQFAFGSTAQGAVNVNTSIILANSQTWTNNSSSSVFATFGNGSAGTITNGGFDLTLDGTGITRLWGSLSGAGGIIKNGAGKVTIGGQFSPAGLDHTYTGATTINGGILQMQANDIGTGNIQITGGVLSQYFGGTFTRDIGGASGQMRITGGVSGFSTQGSSGVWTFTGVGSAPLVWGIAGTDFAPTEFILQASDANTNATGTFTNNIDLNGATRTIRSDQAAGTGSGIFSGNITGTGKLVKVGIGLHNLSGAANTYNGGTDIDGGTLLFSRRTAMPATGAVTVKTGSALGINLGDANGWSTATSGAGTLGGLLSGTGGQTGSTVAFQGDSGLHLNVVATSTYAGVIGNASATNLSLIKSGSSTLTLTGTNTYTGGTVFSAGTLSADSANALGTTGNLTFQGGSLQYTANSDSLNLGSRIKNSTSAITLDTNSRSVAISGIDSTNIGGLAKSGAGTLTLSGTNAYTGGTTINAGTLVAVGTSALGSGAITFATGSSTLQLQQDGATPSVTNTWAIPVRNFTHTIVVDRESQGAANDWTLTQNIPELSGNTLIFQKGANITSGTPTVTLSSGLASSDSTPGTIKIVADGVNVRVNNISNTRQRIMELAGNTTGNEVYGSITQNNSFPSSLLKSDTGTWTLSGNNSGTSAYSNGTTVTGGILNTTQATALASFSTAGKVIINGGTLGVRVGGAGWTTTQVDTMLTNATKTSGAIGIDTTNGNLTQWTAFTTTNLGSTLGLTKLGSNALTLDQVNTYTGATTVSAGTLEIGAGGSTAAGSAVTVNNTANLVVNGTLNGTLLANASTTVSGTGTIAGNANILGTHNPGNSPGIQTYGADLTYSGGASIVNWELGDNTTTNAANPNANYDQILVGGNLAFTGATTLNLLFAGVGSTVLWADSLWDTDQSWTLYDVTGTTTNFANFGLTTANWLDSGSNAFDTSRTGNSFSLSQSGQDVILNYTVIPEPNTALLGAIGVLALLRRRR